MKRKLKPWDEKDQILFQNQVAICQKHLEKALGQNYIIQPLAAYESYMTALYYHRNGPPPKMHQIYDCKLEINNKYDPNAIGIYQGCQRIAYVPTELSKHLSDRFRSSPITIILLAYCKGHTTARSSQCFYTLFKIQ